MPFGAPNKFEEVVTRIKAAKPDVVVITLVGADNVNFNRTFAGFGLDKDITRLAFLLEENTLMGVGAESSANLYSCMGYFANDPSAANTKFKAAYSAKFGAKAPPLSTIGVDCYAGVNAAHQLVTKAGGTDTHKLMAASEGPDLRHRVGPRDHARAAGRQEYVPRRLQGHPVRGDQNLRRREKRQRLQGLRDRTGGEDFR